MQEISDLNDLRLVAWIGESGTLAGAARRLGVNHATVFRRLNQLESQLGVRLFERSGGRYHATPAGEELMRAGSAIANTASEALLRVAGQDLRPSGTVRLTTTDSIALSILPPALALCRQLYPQITLSLAVDNHAANLSKRDADIAIRPTAQPPEHLIGKQLGPLPFAVYGARDYLAQHAELPLAQQQWIALDEGYSGHRTLRWLEGVLPLEQVGIRTSSFGLIRDACQHGLGLAVLPSILGERGSSLLRLGQPIESCATSIWLLLHPDLRETTRIKVVFQLLQRELGKALS